MKERVHNFLESLFGQGVLSSFAYVGSYAIGEKCSDIDSIMLISTSKDELYSIILNMGFECNWEDDCIRINNLSEVPFSIRPFYFDELKELFNLCVSGELIYPAPREWAISGWNCEIFLSDLHEMQIVYDKDNALKEYKNLLEEYPQELKLRLIKYCTSRIEFLSSLKLDNSYVKAIIEGELISNKIRLYYAQREEYFRGYKHIKNITI